MLEHAKSDRIYSVAALIPALAALVYILAFGVNVPYFDEWLFVDYLKAFNERGNWLGQIFAQDAEHRHFFPNLVMLALARLTAWDVRAEMLFSFALSCAGFLFLLSLLRRTRTSSGPVLLISSLLYFNLGQWENMLWGWQLSMYMMTVSVLAAVFFLDRLGTRYASIAPACAAGTIASFSFMNGLLVWPAGTVQILISGTEREIKIRAIFAWVAAAVVNLVVYLHGYALPAEHGGIMASVHNAFSVPLFLFANLGAMLGDGVFASSVLAGLLLAGLLAFSWRRLYGEKTLSANAPLVALGLFAIASAAAITFGRVGLGPQQALISRYTTVSVLGIIAAVALGFKVFLAARPGPSPLMRYFATAALTVLFTGIASYDVYGLVWGYRTCEKRMTARRYLLDYKNAPDDKLEMIFPSADKVHERAAYLERNRLNVFSD